MGLAAGLTGGLGWRGTSEQFAEGFCRMALAAGLVGFARAISVVLGSGLILDTIANALFSPLRHLSLSLSAAMLLISESTLAFPMPSDSGRAFMSLPVTTPPGGSSWVVAADGRDGVPIQRSGVRLDHPYCWGAAGDAGGRGGFLWKVAPLHCHPCRAPACTGSGGNGNRCRAACSMKRSWGCPRAGYSALLSKSDSFRKAKKTGPNLLGPRTQHKRFRIKHSLAGFFRHNWSNLCTRP